MLDTVKLDHQISQFLAFLKISEKTQLSEQINRFFTDKSSKNREVLHDSGAIQMFVDGRLKQKLEIGEGVNIDRIVKFDGKVITDINHHAYLNNVNAKVDVKIHSKGDGARKRSGNTSSGGASSNNNNNNNNG
ncbi:hypothetical protein MNBD_GAMMA11-3422 [hydrothermal vent metagenome]|uniref:Uncharacterized protein n=1 Tax=hydrothermal vent metagenome TaxID=652676 RepID=A0A3B0YD65_9ZZZZ